MHRTNLILLGSTLVTMSLMPQQGTAAPDRLEDRCWSETFYEPFDTLSLRNSETPEGRWISKYIWDRTLIVNNEQQLYIDPLEHGESPFDINEGILTITARPAPDALREQLAGQAYVSGMLNTGQILSNSSFSQRFGRFEAMMKMPPGKGLWPAFWLLPAFDQWPEGGGVLPEIDIVEYLGHETEVFYTSLHTTEGAEAGALVSTTETHRLQSDLSEDFHLYSVSWNEDTIDWYFDRNKVFTMPTPKDLIWPMHLILNLAVGGNWPGSPDASTPFPAKLEVDYIQVFEDSGEC